MEKQEPSCNYKIRRGEIKENFAKLIRTIVDKERKETNDTRREREGEGLQKD